MARPTLITVKGTYLKLDGAPESGSIQFFSPVTVLKSGDRDAVVPSSVKATLDSAGSFELQVPASNDPAWLPSGWEYRVVLRTTSDFSSFKTVMPYDAAGAELFITDLLPAQPGGSALYAAFNHVHSGYVQESTVDQIVADAIEETVGPTIDAAVDAAIAEIVDDFALVSHTHAAADIVSGTIALARLPVGVGSNQVAAGDHTHNYDSVYAAINHNHNSTYSLLAHTHNYSDIVGTPTLDKAAVGLANVDNTSDANKPVSSATQTALNLKAPLASPTFTGTVSGISKSMVGLGNVDNTSDANKPVSSAQQTALDLKAPLASPTFTGTVNGITKAMVGLSEVDNTSDEDKPVSVLTQTELDLKAPLASPTFTGTVSGITKSMIGLANVDNTADSAKPVSTAQQTALNLKANLASPTFTGTVSGISKAMVGLGNVDNTSDAAKPVSTATQTALDGKAATSHTHTIANVTGLQTALDGKQAAGSYALASDITALDTRVDAVEDMTPVVFTWNGSAYVESTTARVYVGPNDPGSVPDGSVWIDTTP
jgi:hypothetical protein